MSLPIKYYIDILKAEYNIAIKEETFQNVESQEWKLSQFFIKVFHAPQMPSRKHLLDDFYNRLIEKYKGNPSEYSYYLLKLFVHCPAIAQKEPDLFKDVLKSFQKSLEDQLDNDNLWQKAEKIFSYIDEKQGSFSPEFLALCYRNLTNEDSSENIKVIPHWIGASSKYFRSLLFSSFIKKEVFSKSQIFFIEFLKSKEDKKFFAELEKLDLESCWKYYAEASEYQIDCSIKFFEELILKKSDDENFIIAGIHAAYAYSSLTLRKALTEKLEKILKSSTSDVKISWENEGCEIKLIKINEKALDILNALVNSGDFPKYTLIIESQPFRTIFKGFKKYSGALFAKTTHLRLVNARFELTDLKNFQAKFSSLEYLDINLLPLLTIITNQNAKNFLPNLKGLFISESCCSADLIKLKNLATIFPSLVLCIVNEKESKEELMMSIIHYDHEFCDDFTLICYEEGPYTDMQMAFFKELSDEHIEFILSSLKSHLADVRSLEVNSCKKLTGKGFQLLLNVMPMLNQMTLTNISNLEPLLEIIGKSNLPNIKNIQFRGCNFQDVKFSTFLNNQLLVKNLTLLNLVDSTGISDDFISALSNLKNLKSLGLANTKSSCFGLKELIGAKTLDFLTNLAVDGLEDINDDNLAFLIRHLPKLSHISANECKNLTNEFFLKLKKPSSLVQIDLNNCPGISGKEFLEFLQKNKLNSFNPSLYEKIMTSGELISFRANFPYGLKMTIEEFIIDLNQQIDDKTLFQSIATVHSLKLINCPEGLDLNCLSMIPQSLLMELKSLDLSEIPRVPTKVLNDLISKNKVLKTLKISKDSEFPTAVLYKHLEYEGPEEFTHSHFSSYEVALNWDAAQKIKIDKADFTHNLDFNNSKVCATLQKCIGIRSLKFHFQENIPSDVFLSLIEKNKETLETVDLANTKIAIEDIQKLSNTISTCEKLKNLYFDSCDIPLDLLQAFVKNSKQLENLFIGGYSKLNDDFITNLPSNLKSLSVPKSGIFSNNTLIKLLQRSTELKSLNLSDLDLSPEFLESISQFCPNLDKLNLNNCLTKSIKSLLTFLDSHHLIAIGLQNWSLKDEDLEQIINKLPNLIRIDIGGCSQLTEKSLRSLDKIQKNLIGFGIGGTLNIPFESLKKWIDDTSISFLNLDNTTLDEEQIQKLLSKSKINFLQLKNDHPINFQALKDYLARSQGNNISSVNITNVQLNTNLLTTNQIEAVETPELYIPQQTGTFFECTPTKFIGLKKVVFRFMPSEKLLKKIITQNPELKKIRIQGPGELSLDSIELISTCKNLEELELQSLNLNDQALQIISECQQLKFLDLNGESISERGFETLSGLKKLKKFYVDKGTYLNDEVVGTLINNCSLTEISLKNCKNLTDRTLKNLEKCNELEVLDISSPEIKGTYLMAKCLSQNSQSLNKVFFDGWVIDSEILKGLEDCKKLTHISFRNCNLNKSIVEQIFISCSNLTEMDIEDRKIDFADFGNSFSQKLKRLDIINKTWSQEEFSKKDSNRIRKNFPNSMISITFNKHRLTLLSYKKNENVESMEIESPQKRKAEEEIDSLTQLQKKAKKDVA